MFVLYFSNGIQQRVHLFWFQVWTVLKNIVNIFNFKGGYKLTIFSDNPVDLTRLDENQNAVMIGRWDADISDGGCHLHFDPYEKELNNKTWTNNPKFHL